MPPKQHIVNRSGWLTVMALSWLGMAAFSIWAFLHVYQNQAYIEVGKNGCASRPAWEYFDRCNARFDSPACMHEAQTNLAYWYGEFDTQCASMEDPRVFRFPVPNPERDTLEVAEVD